MEQAIDPHLGLILSGCSVGVSAWRAKARSGLAETALIVLDSAERVEVGLFEHLWHLPPGSRIRVAGSTQTVTNGWSIGLSLDGVWRSIGLAVDGSMRMGEPTLGTLPPQLAQRCLMSVTGDS